MIPGWKVNLPLERVVVVACMTVALHIDRRSRERRIHGLEAKGEKSKIGLQTSFEHGRGITNREVRSRRNEGGVIRIFREGIATSRPRAQQSIGSRDSTVQIVGTDPALQSRVTGSKNAI